MIAVYPTNGTLAFSETVCLMILPRGGGAAAAAEDESRCKLSLTITWEWQQILFNLISYSIEYLWDSNLWVLRIFLLVSLGLLVCRNMKDTVSVFDPFFSPPISSGHLQQPLRASTSLINRPCGYHCCCRCWSGVLESINTN